MKRWRDGPVGADERDSCDATLKVESRRQNFIFHLDKLVVRIHLQFKPESFTTKSCPRAHERVAAGSSLRFPV